MYHGKKCIDLLASGKKIMKDPRSYTFAPLFTVEAEEDGEIF